jgi:hypothetical protein
MSEWQPYFLAYCRATNIAPENVSERDGNNAPYIIWISQQWRAWADETGCKDPNGYAHGEQFGKWLEARTTISEAA